MSCSDLYGSGARIPRHALSKLESAVVQWMAQGPDAIAVYSVTLDKGVPTMTTALVSMTNEDDGILRARAASRPDGVVAEALIACGYCQADIDSIDMLCVVFLLSQAVAAAGWITRWSVAAHRCLIQFTGQGSSVHVKFTLFGSRFWKMNWTGFDGRQAPLAVPHGGFQAVSR